MLPMSPPIIWFFGRAGSGKSTLAKEMVRQLEEEAGYKTALIEGDDFRKAIHPSLGFSKKDVAENITRAIAFAKDIIVKNGKLPVCTFVTPTRESRDIIKKVAGGTPVYFIHVYCEDKQILLDRRVSRGNGAKYGQTDRLFKFEGRELDHYFQVDTGRDTELEHAVRDLRQMFEGSGPSHPRRD